MSDDRKDLAFFDIEINVFDDIVSFLLIAIRKVIDAHDLLLRNGNHFLLFGAGDVFFLLLEDALDLGDRILFRSIGRSVDLFAAQLSHFPEKLGPLRKLQTQVTDHIHLREYVCRRALHTKLAVFQNQYAVR